MLLSIWVMGQLGTSQTALWLLDEIPRPTNDLTECRRNDRRLLMLVARLTGISTVREHVWNATPST